MRVVPVEGGGYVAPSGHALVLPGCGGVAHVGGLSVDALISTLGLSRVALVLSHNLLPMATASAWAEPGSAAGGEQEGNAPAITTAAELYQGPAAPGLTVLQLRSAAASGRRSALAEEVLAWARKESVAEILLVASCSSHVKVDADLAESTSMRFVQVTAGGEGAVGDPAAFSPPTRKPGLSLDASVPPLRAHPPPRDPEVDESGEVLPVKEEPQPPLPELVFQLVRGSGLARSLLLLAAEGTRGEKAEAPPDVLCLLGFTSETLDPLLVERLAKASLACVAGLTPAKEVPALKPPASWRLQLAEQAALEQRLFA